MLNVPAPKEANAKQGEGNSNSNVTFSLPTNLPPTPGNKPTILHGVTDLTEDKYSTKLFVILNEAKNGDDESKKELSEILTNTVRGEVMGMLLAIKKSNKVALGHSQFKYNSSQLRKMDNHHGSTLVYIGDRKQRGDPPAFEMDEETVEKMGGTVLVEGVKDQSLLEKFYEDDNNKDKLYIPEKNATMEEREVAAVLPASNRTIKFVLEKEPSFLDLYKYAEGLKDADEKQAIQEWAMHACQTKPGDTSKKPSSILAHKLEPVPTPSAELEELLGKRLDQTIGQAVPMVPPPRQLATDASVVAERQAQDREGEMLRLMKKQLENPKPKEKWSEMQKNRWCGWSNQPTWDTCSAALKRLEPLIGKPDEMAQQIWEEMKATAKRHGLRLNGVNITKAVATMMGKA